MKKWILIAIVAFAAFLRLWNLGSVPPSLTQDEASLGYNAYSILKTGKDEYGKTLPIIFKSFGDYKPGLYVYLDVPFIATLGLNEVSTRLPSAIAGILAVYLIFLIARKLFDEKTATAATFIAAVNPWLIYYSRGAWETNVVLTLTLAGVYFFLKSLEDSKQLLLSALFFALTFITYQGAKLSTMIVVLILSAVYFRDLIKIDKKYIAGSAFLALLVSVPIILSFFTGQSGRLKVFSIFSYPRPQEYTQAFLNQGREKIGDINYYLFHSETLNFARGIVGRWSNYMGAKFLFIDGDYQNPQHTPPYQGMFFATDIIFLLTGLYFIFKKGIGKPAAFILLWVALAPLPGALSRDQVNAIRAMNMAAPLIFIMALGLVRIYSFLRELKGISAVAARCTFLAIYLFVFVYFLDALFIHVPMHNSSYWNYGYKEMVNYVFGPNYLQIVCIWVCSGLGSHILVCPEPAWLFLECTYSTVF